MMLQLSRKWLSHNTQLAQWNTEDELKFSFVLEMNVLKSKPYVNLVINLRESKKTNN